jgi:hypothetical protein
MIYNIIKLMYKIKFDIININSLWWIIKKQIILLCFSKLIKYNSMRNFKLKLFHQIINVINHIIKNTDLIFISNLKKIFNFNIILFNFYHNPIKNEKRQINIIIFIRFSLISLSNYIIK